MPFWGSNARRGNTWITFPVLFRQASADPASGDLCRIFIDAASAPSGVDVREIGHAAADPLTDRSTARVGEIPQVPFAGIKISFIGGQGAVTSSPPTSSFSLHATPGGGARAASLAARPFAPSFMAAPTSSTAGAFSPLSLQLTRSNGQQEPKAATIALAPGRIAKLAGVPCCSASALAAAAATSGAAQSATPSCPVPERGRDLHGAGRHRPDAAPGRRQGLPLGAL